MGWSCRKETGDTLERWRNACREQTNSSNLFVIGDAHYFFEVSSREHDDGSATGSLWMYLSNTRAKSVGSFKIDANGRLARSPTALKILDRGKLLKVA
jgi:hypothetical protein